MVFGKIKNMFSDNKEKYEILYYKYSQIKLENQRLKRKFFKDKEKYKEKIDKKVMKNMIDFYRILEDARNDSFNVKAKDKETEKLLLSLNKVYKNMKYVFCDFSLKEFSAEERFFDPKLHEVASYESVTKGFKKGVIVKTAKTGIKYKDEVIEKPKVVVAK